MKLVLLLLALLANKDSLDRIVADTWQYRLDHEPALRLQQGLPIENLPEISEESSRQETAAYRALLERLNRIDPASLKHEDWLTWAVLEWELKQGVGAADHLALLSQITPYTLPLPGVHEVYTRHTFSSREDLDRYRRLLRQYPRWIGQIQARAEWQRTKGFLIPKETVDQMVPLFRAFAQPAERSLFAVAPERLRPIDPKESEAFRAQVAKVVEEEVNPALERLAAMLEGDYRKAAPERVGLGQYPGGPEAYRFLVRQHTGLEVTPEEVHRRGLEEVARLEARMAEIRRQVGFAGTQRQFHDMLRTDPRFLAKTPAEVGERLMAPVRKIEPLIGRYFQRIPKAPYGVKRLEAELEGSVTFGYYKQPGPEDPSGWYFFNGSRLEQRPLVNAAALIYHELLPGHHFQIALQQENGALPKLRSNLYHTAFVEGWGEYASELGIEMGLYDDPYAMYGRLAMDMFLSNRLVVDTGMNALGWPRSKAIEYMRDRLLETPVQIDTETLRYSTSMPGQALAYKMGSARIWELRRRAERELGPKFDLRRFHEAVLGSGSLPLSVLERHVEWWIGQEKAR
ncbi:MAG TPA: DUF885 domain-containing protein [Thermoanaerobaculia bacterium]|jgi:uncharacterized protein (DUF885 family)|nr:DUF885 domain-containing protein [Thermoanaerobaculia bacterium]